MLSKSGYYLTKAKFHRIISYSFYRTKFRRPSNISTEEIVGMNVDEFNEHLERTFLERYEITTEQYLKYFRKRLLCVDHIVPLRFAESVEDVIRLCHYNNLQLILAKDNVGKEKGRDINKNHYNLKYDYIMADYFAAREKIV